MSQVDHISPGLLHKDNSDGVQCVYSETSLIRHSMGPGNNVGLGGCWSMECLLPYLCMVTVPHIMVGLERMLDYRGVGLARFHCSCAQCTHVLSPASSPPWRTDCPRCPIPTTYSTALRRPSCCNLLRHPSPGR